MNAVAPARHATALALALVVPVAAGLVFVLLGDRTAGADEDVTVEKLALLLGVNALVAVVAHSIAALAAGSLLRLARFSASPLAQPAALLGVLRPLGALLLTAGALVPSLRQPLVGVALAMLDAAFVASLLLVVAPSLGALERRARVVAGGYALVRMGTAVAVVSSPDAPAAAALAHRLLGAMAIAAVAWVLSSLAETLRHEAV